MIMRNEKAQGISMNVVILAAIAVMVLLLVGTFMSGGFKALTGKITSFVGAGPSSELSAAKISCENACTVWKEGGCKVRDFTDVDRKCSQSLVTAAAAWPTPQYEDTRDGKFYISTCRRVIGGAAEAACTWGQDATSLTQVDDWISFNVEGAGGTCTCKSTYKQGGTGWGN